MNQFKRVGFSGSGAGSSVVKATVGSVSALPLIGNFPNDIRYVIAEKNFYTWDGTAWSAQLLHRIQNIDNLITLSGVAADSASLGAFTGSTIPDDQTIKAAIQALETALEALPDPMEYKGLWNASTNTPALSDGTGNNGDVWFVSVAGTQFTPSIVFKVGDKAVYNGATGKYEKWDVIDPVDTDEVPEGVTNLYFTEERAQDAVGSILTDSSSIDFTYNDAGNSITAAVLPSGVDHDSLQNFVGNEHIDHSTISITAGAGLSGGGDLTASRTISMPNVGTASSVGSASQTLSITTDAQGRVTAKSENNILITSSQVSDFAESSQDSIGSILVDSDTIDLTYDDATPTISAAVKVQQSITSDTSGVKLVGDSTTPGNGKYYGTDTAGTRGYFDLPIGARPNDISEASVALTNNQAVAASITGFLFNSASVRSFKSLVSVEISATSSLFEGFEIVGINKNGSWEITIIGAGDDSLVVFSITSGGQLQYTSGNYAGFVDGTIRFRAITTSF